MIQQTTPPLGYGDLSFDDILKYGIIRSIDSELGNPPAPTPYGGDTQSTQQYQTTATGSGVETKKAGTLGIGGVNVPSSALLLGAAVLVGGFILFKVA